MKYDLWPGCSTHYDFTFKYDTWYDYAWEAPYSPHATIHSIVGGYTNCGDLVSEMETRNIIPSGGSLEQAVGAFAQDLILLPKDLWRSNLTESPQYCSMDTDIADCHMVCQGTSDEWMLNMVEDNSFSFGSWSEDLTREQKIELGKLACR